MSNPDDYVYFFFDEPLTKRTDLNNILKIVEAMIIDCSASRYYDITCDVEFEVIINGDYHLGSIESSSLVRTTIDLGDREYNKLKTFCDFSRLQKSINSLMTKLVDGTSEIIYVTLYDRGSYGVTIFEESDDGRR